jgi:hypothetical protein
VRKVCSFIFACILVLSGCTSSGDISDTCNVVVTPPVLDFGRVRVEDSPLSLSFDIENTGEEPLKIVDISSGCGCTVIDIPQEPILSKEKKSLAVKVNLYGRSGEFTNTVFIKTADHGTLFIDIRGTIVTDIWFSGQSVRLTAEPGKSEAKTIFSLFTQDYPDIQFDWSSLPPEIEIQEISRSVSEGICNIQFALSIFIGDNNAQSHQLIIIPQETSIAPLILPIYCYRSETGQQRAAFSTTQVSLGAVDRNETKVFRIYGNPDVIHVIKEIAWKNVPSGITAEILRHDSNVNDVLEVALNFSEDFPSGFFGGEIHLKTLGGQEFALPINGEVCE